MEKSTSLKVEKNLKSNQGDQADKFMASIKEVTTGISNVKMGVQALLGAGDQYKTITDVEKMDGGEETHSLQHVPG